MSDKRQIPLIELILCLSKAMDLISERLIDHHRMVAYIAACLAADMGLSVEKQKEVLLAGALHDCGALSLKERLSIMDFEIGWQTAHAEQGYLLLSTFRPFESIAGIIRYHHRPWRYGEGASCGDKAVPDESFILNVADRVAVLVDKDEEILGQAQHIGSKLIRNSGSFFRPDAVEAALRLFAKECFWFDLISPSLESIIRNQLGFGAIKLGADELLSLSRLFARIIDFRSSFTATHSTGVAAVAEAIGRIMRFQGDELVDLKTSGYLHDLGKLVIPREILEAPRSLTRKELNVMRSHTYHTYHLLEPLDGLSTITAWAAFHHEHLDGSGYPFHLDGDSLSAGARIVAVADVFTAVTEDRPYRKAMKKQNALQALEAMAGCRLDEDTISCVTAHFDELDAICRTARERADREFSSLKVDSPDKMHMRFDSA